MNIIIGGKNIMNDEVQTVAETTNAVSEVAKTGLSKGAKYGIASAVAAMIAAGAVVTVVFMKKHKAKKETKVVEEQK